MRWGLLYVVRFSLQQSWSMITGLDWGSPWGWHWAPGQMWVFHHSLLGFGKASCIGSVYSLSSSLAEGQTGKKPRYGQPTRGLLLFYIFKFSLGGAWGSTRTYHRGQLNDFDLPFHSVGTTEESQVAKFGGQRFWLRHLTTPHGLLSGKSEDPQSFLIQRHCDVDSLRWCWDLGFSLNPHISCYRETHSSSFSGLMCTWVCVCACTNMCVQMCVHG